jgi:hypothetical protein
MATWKGCALGPDVGDGSAAWALAGLLAEHGDLDGLRTRADAGDPYAAELVDRDPHQIDQMLSSRADAGYGNAAPLTRGGYVLPLHVALDELRTRAAHSRIGVTDFATSNHAGLRIRMHAGDIRSSA